MSQLAFVTIELLLSELVSVDRVASSFMCSQGAM